MVEIIAAVLSGSVGSVLTTVLMFSSRARENRDAAIRLTVAVENVATRLEELHNDIRIDRQEMYGRLRDLEQRTARLEGRSSHA
jgi:hypothetical protein